MTKSIPDYLTGNAIRKTFIDYFVKMGHTFVPSSSLVPGGDSTLLFTNAGMVQFKDVFLGTDKRPYTRTTNSQKCMRVAGKHNDFDDVGRDDTHHTFFEMLGNWSFGDYYKKEAIEWAWHLFTEVWGLPKEHFYATVFKDDEGDIATDEEAVEHWRDQPGFNPAHIFYLGRKDNFWEMADTGPCGPNSEIHLDLRPEEGPVAADNLNTDRFIELWNLVFIQYNRTGPDTIEPLLATHVDTGLGLERIVAVLQGVESNYRTDLLWPLIEKTQELTGQTNDDCEANFTPYRVIADHARAAAFLIADGIVPGNLGRNYVIRMVIRRAYRFGGMIGLNESFLAKVAAIVVENYGEAYPELVRHRETILNTITREEVQFQRTLDKATTQLEHLLDQLKTSQKTTLPGEQAADLYTTHGMPFEITRDIAREHGLEVDEAGFDNAMDAHRQISGAGTAMGIMGEDNKEIYATLLKELLSAGDLDSDGVVYDPYSALEVVGSVLGLVRDGKIVHSVNPGDPVEVLLPETCFYVEAGGQVSDTGTIISSPLAREGAGGGNWEVLVTDTHRPIAGVIIHVGVVVHGTPKVGDTALADVDTQRHQDIIRNHTATHLLHASLHEVLGDHARQAGSLVAPDRLRFDFNYPEAVTPQQINQIEQFVTEKILSDYPLQITFKPLQQAIEEGVIALFGEKYAETVRTIRIGDFSYELCGGTHAKSTSFIGTFIITSEGSAAAGIRRIEAITGREAYKYIHRHLSALDETATLLSTNPKDVPAKTESTLREFSAIQKEISSLRNQITANELAQLLDHVPTVNDIPVLTQIIPESDSNVLRQLADRFRGRYPSSVAVLASVKDNRPILIATVTEDLVKRGLHAGELVKFVAQQLGGGGGGKPTMAQAGGKDAKKLEEALSGVPKWVERNLP